MSWNNGQVEERQIDGLSFVLTCLACPEQYDVFQGRQKVGYVRLRHGSLTVEAPDCGGDILLENGDEDVGDGLFETEDLRVAWLTRAASVINARRAASP